VSTEALVADVLEAKYANRHPLTGKDQMFAREGVQLNHSTLAHWVGLAACEPLQVRLVEILKGFAKLLADGVGVPHGIFPHQLFSWRKKLGFKSGHSSSDAQGELLRSFACSCAQEKLTANCAAPDPYRQISHL
jgi:hypothetical protein